MKKSVIGIILAVTLVGSSLSFSVQLHAADVAAGTTKERVAEDESVSNNNGTIE